MANNSKLKASKKNLVCKIVNIEKDPKHTNPQRMIVAVKIDDGDKKLGPWIQGFSLLPDSTFTLTDFMDAMYKHDLKRPEDPYQELKNFLEKGTYFELKLTDKIENKE